MSRFMGGEVSILDAKGRITVPARLRKQIAPESGSDVMLIRGPGNTIHLYPQAQWSVHAERLAGLSKGNPEVRMLMLSLSETACETVIDGAGRVQLTPQLIELAGLKREALVIGNLDHFEIWLPERFKGQVSPVDGPAFDEVFDRIMGQI